MNQYPNLDLFQIENQLNNLFNNIPAGTAYFMLKTKLDEIEKLYREQIQKEYEEYQKQMKEQSTEKKENQSEEGQN